jgi:hypothetical protein
LFSIGEIYKSSVKSVNIVCILFVLVMLSINSIGFLSQFNLFI